MNQTFFRPEQRSAAANKTVTRIAAVMLAVMLLCLLTSCGKSSVPEAASPAADEEEMASESSGETTPSDLSATPLALADYVTLIYTGENGSGTVQVTLDCAGLAADAAAAGVPISSDALEESFAYTLSQADGFSNGETVTVTVFAAGKEETLRDTVYGLSQSAQDILDSVVEEYSNVLSGSLSYYDFIGAEVCQTEESEQDIDIFADGFAEFLSYYGPYDAPCFDTETGYFTPTEKDIAEASGSLCYAFCDVNGDDSPELLIKETFPDATDESVTYDAVLCVWAVQDGAPVKVCASMYRYPLVVCDGGAILRYDAGGVYDHTYTFYSFDALLRGEEEVLERYTISYDADIWSYTTYGELTDLDWVAFDIGG